MDVLASLMQTMLLGFTPPDRAGPGAGHTLKTDFGRGGRPFRYPNRGATMRTFPPDRRLFWRRHVGNTKADDAYFEIEVIGHWHRLQRAGCFNPANVANNSFFGGLLLKMYQNASGNSRY